MSQEIVIDIDEGGNVTIDASKSGSGPDCERLTAEIEAALGVVQKRVRTPEYNKRAVANSRKQTA